jgi:chaperonin cofactor prefoldin
MSDGKKNKRGHGGNTKAWELLVAVNDANVTNPVKMTDKVYQQVCNAAKITPTMDGTELALRVTGGYEVLLFQQESQKVGQKIHYAERSLEVTSSQLQAKINASTSSLKELGKVLSEGLQMGARTQGGRLHPLVYGLIKQWADETQNHPHDKTQPFKELAMDAESLQVYQEIGEAMVAFAGNYNKESTLRSQLNEHATNLETLEMQRRRSEERIEAKQKHMEQEIQAMRAETLKRLAHQNSQHLFDFGGNSARIIPDIERVGGTPGAYESAAEPEGTPGGAWTPGDDPRGAFAF